MGILRIQRGRDLIWPHGRCIERYAISDEAWAPAPGIGWRRKLEAGEGVNLRVVGSDGVLVKQIGESRCESEDLCLAHLVVLLEVKVTLHVPRSAVDARAPDGERAGSLVLRHVDPVSTVRHINRPPAASVANIQVGAGG